MTTTDRQVFAALKRSICCPRFKATCCLLKSKFLFFSSEDSRSLATSDLHDPCHSIPQLWCKA